MAHLPHITTRGAQPDFSPGSGYRFHSDCYPCVTKPHPKACLHATLLQTSCGHMHSYSSGATTRVFWNSCSTCNSQPTFCADRPLQLLYLPPTWLSLLCYPSVPTPHCQHTFTLNQYLQARGGIGAPRSRPARQQQGPSQPLPHIPALQASPTIGEQ